MRIEHAAASPQVLDMLRENEEKYRSLFNNAEIGMFRTKLDGSEVIDFNDKYLEIFGYTREDMAGSMAAIHWADPAQRQEMVRRLEECGRVVNFECRMINKQGNERQCLTSIRLYKDKGILEGSVVDVSDLRLAQCEKEHLSFMLDIAPGLVMANDLKGNILYANKQACDLHGYTHDEIMKMNLFDLIDPRRGKASDATMEQMFKSGSASFETIHLRKDGSALPLLVNFRPVEWDGHQVVVSVSTDLTAHKRAEAHRIKLENRLQQMQKLESLGVLAGGIAHDFNNLLSGIFGYTDLAQSESSEELVRTYLSKALTSIERARALTQQLITFAKGGAPERKPGSLFPFIREAAQFALSGSAIPCRIDAPPSLWTCDFDKNQLGQVIDNIIINARQAMPSGGSITVTAENVSLEGSNAAGLGSGNYVRISITDTGTGIPPEVLPRIFDPFFTTKKAGNGLGLATSYSIVRRHGGGITVESKRGCGSTFHVFLPAASPQTTEDASGDTGSKQPFVNAKEDVLQLSK